MLHFLFRHHKHPGDFDLTKGTIWKTILRFSFPILVSYLFQNLYSITDSAVCGYTLSASEISGVNDTSSISFIFLQFAFGCTAGMSVILSNHTGRKDYASVRKALATQIVLSLFIVAIVTVTSFFAIDPLLNLLGVTNGEAGSVNNAVYDAAYAYISIILGGMIGQFSYNLICCVLRSLGNAIIPLVFLIISGFLNLVLDLVFIMACGWGVAGAAAATVISQSISAIACFVFTFVHYKELRLKISDFKAMDIRTSFHTLWQGVPLGLQFSVLAFGILTMSNGVISFDKMPDGTMIDGTPAQIGYGAGCRLDGIFFTPLSALATAMISFTGQNNGAGKIDRIRSGILQCTVMLLIICSVEIAVGYLLSINGFYQRFFLSNDKITPATIRFGNTYLYSALPFLFILGELLVLRNVVQGLEKPLYPFLAGFSELIARIAVCIILPPLVNGGPINSEASTMAFFCLGLADAMAWMAAVIILVTATIVTLKRPKQSSDKFVDSIGKTSSESDNVANNEIDIRQEDIALT